MKHEYVSYSTFQAFALLQNITCVCPAISGRAVPYHLVTFADGKAGYISEELVYGSLAKEPRAYKHYITQPNRNGPLLVEELPYLTPRNLFNVDTNGNSNLQRI